MGGWLSELVAWQCACKSHECFDFIYFKCACYELFPTKKPVHIYVVCMPEHAWYVCRLMNLSQSVCCLIQATGGETAICFLIIYINITNTGPRGTIHPYMHFYPAIDGIYADIYMQAS
jgi:hypothetical protein